MTTRLVALSNEHPTADGITHVTLEADGARVVLQVNAILKPADPRTR